MSVLSAFDPTQPIVIASHNSGKVREMRALLQEVSWSCVGASDLNLPEPEETGETFAANAQLKAAACARASGLLALADDSGLCVQALQGAPGIYSARWGGPNRDFTVAMSRIREALADHEDRRAWFVCALALVAPGGESVVVEGRVDGEVVFPARGNQGFGYDPIFIPDGERETFGEMDPARKEAMSHRRRAWVKLLDLVQP